MRFIGRYVMAWLWARVGPISSLALFAAGAYFGTFWISDFLLTTTDPVLHTENRQVSLIMGALGAVTLSLLLTLLVAATAESLHGVLKRRAKRRARAKEPLGADLEAEFLSVAERLYEAQGLNTLAAQIKAHEMLEKAQKGRR